MCKLIACLLPKFPRLPSEMDSRRVSAVETCGYRYLSYVKYIFTRLLTNDNGRESLKNARPAPYENRRWLFLGFSLSLKQLPDEHIILTFSNKSLSCVHCADP